MVMEDNQSCSSRVVESPAVSGRQDRMKLQIYNDVLQRLKESSIPEAQEPCFDHELWSHFNRLPARYALDVNVERAEDVLTHKRLLHLAHDPANRPAFEVRLVQVSPVSDRNMTNSVHSGSPRTEYAQSIHPPPVFCSSPNLEALALEANKAQLQEGDSDVNGHANIFRPIHEIIFSTVDKPKLLSQLTSLLAEVGLNILEAHAFSTVDGYSLGVFVVDGWPYKEIDQLHTALGKELLKVKDNESCSSIVVESPTMSKHQHKLKLEVYNDVLQRLRKLNIPEAQEPGFDDDLWSHFNRLPTGYALIVNVERAEDVIFHKRLLHLAHDPYNRPAFEVRLVQVSPVSDGNMADSVHSGSPRIESAQRSMHEITFSTDDKPKLLSQLTSLLSEVGLNIQEAYAFSTIDGYSLGVFVVDGWPSEEIDQLHTALEKELFKVEVVAQS